MMYNYPFFSFPHLRRYPSQYIPRTPYIKPNIKKEEPKICKEEKSKEAYYGNNAFRV